MPAPAADPFAGFLQLLQQRDGQRNGGSSVAIVVAHPDDETIGIGGHLDRLDGVRVVHVTDGAPRDLMDARLHGFTNWRDYAAARRSEAERALARAGISPSSLISLGFPDKEAARHLPELARCLAAFLAETGPRYLCTHSFEGGHPDHDATAFAVHAGCRLLREEGGRPPFVVEMPLYHAGADGPVYQDFCAEPAVPSISLPLDEAAYERKRRMLACHFTQRDVLAPFVAWHERFRAAPRYDFGAPPNGGRLHYESLPVGFTGDDWQKSASAAIQALGLQMLELG